MRVLGGSDHPIFQSTLYLPECLNIVCRDSRLSLEADLVWFYSVRK